MIVLFEEKSQLLNILKLENITGKIQEKAISDALHEGKLLIKLRRYVVKSPF